VRFSWYQPVYNTAGDGSFFNPDLFDAARPWCSTGRMRGCGNLCLRRDDLPRGRSDHDRRRDPDQYAFLDIRRQNHSRSGDLNESVCAHGRKAMRQASTQPSFKSPEPGMILPT